MRFLSSITDVANALETSLNLCGERERTYAAIRRAHHTFSDYGRISEREYSALCRAVWADLYPDDEYPWSTEDAETET